MAEIQAFLHQARAAKKASKYLATADTATKNTALIAMAESLNDQASSLINANAKDLKTAQEQGISKSLLDRLALNSTGIQGMCEGLHQVAVLPDPVGTVDQMAYRPSGIQVGKMRVPMGVIGIIYESRPNVTIDAASLCLKSGNACLLRGGHEAFYSNQALSECIQVGLARAGLPEGCVQVLSSSDRRWVSALLSAKESVDLVIPRGGKRLIQRVNEEAQMPVLKHLEGICHVYIAPQANEDKSLAIAINAKTHRYGVCNAMETLLVDQSQLALLPSLVRALIEKGIELRLCERSQAVIQDMGIKGWRSATEDDWSTEYLDAVLSIKAVAGLDEAISHINDYGSGHTDAIVTESIALARQFLRQVDSSSVMVNASTRFADGFEYGLGAEIGISTDKLHARGPVGLLGLTTEKYVVIGDGHIRD